MNKKFLKDYLFLFDIDGTIIDTKSKSKEAFFYAFEKVNNIKISEIVSFLGGIDNLIFKRLYDNCKLPESIYAKKWNDFKNLYRQTLLKIKTERSMLFTHAKKTIKYLFKNSNIALVTGNIKECALIKMKLFSLERYLFIGGFGDSAADRTEIVGEALDTAKKHYQKEFDKNKIILFGDTEKDVESAQSSFIKAFLIDHKKINRENTAKWKADFYGDFTSLPALIKILETNRPEYDKPIYFL